LNIDQTDLGISVLSSTASAGMVTLSAPIGTVTLNTIVDADALSSGGLTSEIGGTVIVTGTNVFINSAISASGVNGGGTIAVHATNNLNVAATISALTDPTSIANNGNTPPAGGMINLSGGGAIIISNDINASDLSPSQLFSQPSTPSTISISGTGATTLTIATGYTVKADLQNGVTALGMLGNPGPMISITNIGTINLAGTLESVAGSGNKGVVPLTPVQLGQINITNSLGSIAINNKNTIQGDIIGNSTNISSSAGSVDAFIGSVTALTPPFPASLVPSTSVSGSAATGFTLTVLNDNLTLGTSVAVPAIQSNTGNINLSLLSSGNIQINSNIHALAGDVTISNPSEALNVTTTNASVIGNNVTLTAKSASTISLSGTFSAAAGGILTISVGSVPGKLVQGTPQLNNAGNGQIFWNGSNSANFIGAAATVNATSPGEIIFNPGTGRILLAPLTNITAVSYVAPRAVAGLELSRKEIEQIGCLLYEGSLYRGSDAEHLMLIEGRLLLSPSRHTDIDCGDSVIHLRENSCLLVERNAKGLRIYCLSDQHWNGSVTVENKSDGAVSTVYGGQKLVIGNDEASFEILRDDRVGERSVHSDSVRCQSISEFSLPSLLKQHALLHELRSSADPIAQSTHVQILKKAAALSIVQAAHGPYRVYQRSTGIAI